MLGWMLEKTAVILCRGEQVTPAKSLYVVHENGEIQSSLALVQP